MRKKMLVLSLFVVMFLLVTVSQSWACDAKIVGFFKYSNNSAIHGFMYDVGSESYTEINIPGAVDTRCHDINDNSMIVGSYKDSNNVWHTFLYDIDTGLYETISYPESTFTQGWGINNKNHIVGEYEDSSGKRCGFFYDGNEFKTLNYHGAIFNRCHDINNNGKIVARWNNLNDIRYGYHYDGYYDNNGNFCDGNYFFTVFQANASATAATGINDNGIILGWYADLNDSSIQYGYVYDGKNFISYQYPETDFTTGLGINNDLQVVGYYINSNNEIHGFYKDGNNFTPIDFPDANIEYTYCVGISNKVY